MHDHMVIKIIFGLILWSVATLFAVGVGMLTRLKLEEMSKNRKIGTAGYTLVMTVWWMYMVWYWFTLYAEAVAHD